MSSIFKLATNVQHFRCASFLQTSSGCPCTVGTQSTPYCLQFWLLYIWSYYVVLRTVFFIWLVSYTVVPLRWLHTSNAPWAEFDTRASRKRERAPKPSSKSLFSPIPCSIFSRVSAAPCPFSLFSLTLQSPAYFGAIFSARSPRFLVSRHIRCKP